MPEDVAAELIELAHETCPYSKMTREGIETEVVVGSSNRVASVN